MNFVYINLRKNVFGCPGLFLLAPTLQYTVQYFMKVRASPPPRVFPYLFYSVFDSIDDHRRNHSVVPVAFQMINRVED